MSHPFFTHSPKLWETAMEAQKLEIIQKIEAKGLTVEKVAEAIEFDPIVLSLYLAKDAYPVPKRILDKITSTVLN
jgi:hypothetical protein